MTTHPLSVTQARAPLTLGAQRKLQIALGLIWLIDGALQLQPFMFGRAFVTQIIAPNETNQPGFVAAPIRLMAHLIEPRIALFNLVAVAIQVLIGIGLIYRPTVKPALLTSFGWALGVWWIGEGLGGLFTGAVSPLTGAPGAALLYVLAGLIAWPRVRWQTGRTTQVACSASAEPASHGGCSGSDQQRYGCSRATALTRRSTTPSQTHHQAPDGYRASTPPSPPPLPDTEWRSRSAPRAYPPPSAQRCCSPAGPSRPWRSPQQSRSCTSSSVKASAEYSPDPEPTPAPDRSSSCWRFRSTRYTESPLLSDMR